MRKLKTSELYDKKAAVAFYEDRYAQGYMEEWPIEKKQKLYEVIRGLDLPKNGQALDFGCGNGVLTEVIRKALPDWKVYGTDISVISIENAKKRCPQCYFFVMGDEEFANKRFDFLFTNHVLEHVYNLHQIFNEMDNFLKPKSAILHVLPCGNEGSFEYNICCLKKNGINPEFENRFFFEDEGHVRRLNTEQLRKLCARKGFVLTKEYYSNQYYGAINWITQSSLGFIKMFTDMSSAVDEKAKQKLRKLRYCLIGIYILRFPAITVDKIWNKRNKKIKHYILLMGGLPLYVFAKPMDLYWKKKAIEEWRTRKTERKGSEMLLYFTRR